MVKTYTIIKRSKVDLDLFGWLVSWGFFVFVLFFWCLFCLFIYYYFLRLRCFWIRQKKRRKRKKREIEFYFVAKSWTALSFFWVGVIQGNLFYFSSVSSYVKVPSTILEIWEKFTWKNRLFESLEINLSCDRGHHGGDERSHRSGRQDMAVIEENVNCDLSGGHAKLCWPEWKDLNGIGFRDSESWFCFYYNFTHSSAKYGQEWEQYNLDYLRVLSFLNILGLLKFRII